MRTEASFLYFAVFVLSIVLSRHVVTSQECPETRDRRPWRLLSCEEQEEFMVALERLKGSGLYDEFVLTHEWMNESSHGRPGFLPWHRWFIHEFESALRLVAADPCITYVNAAVGLSSP
jgi:hypothetical protein